MSNAVKIAWISAAATVLAALISGLVVFLEREPKSPSRIPTEVTGDSNGVRHPGHGNIIGGISEERYEKILKNAGVNEAAIKRTLNVLGEKEVPEEEYASKLEEFAKRYKDAELRLAATPSGNSGVVVLKQRAKEALEAGDIERAEAFLSQTSVAVAGVPYVLLRAVIEVYPDIWKGEGSLGNLGFGPHPDDYDPTTGKLLPSEQRHPLPYGFVTAEDPALPEGTRTDNVFFSCGTCHTGRVFVDGRVRHYVGAPNTEIEMQAYSGLLYKTGKKLMNPDSPGIDPSQVDPAQFGKIMGFLKTKAEADPAWFYGGRTPAERDAKALRAKTQAARLLANPQAVVAALVGPAIKTQFMYIKLASQFYREKDGQMPPGLFGPRPGRMDAFGISATLVALHAAGVAGGKIAPKDSFLNRLPDDHPFFQGLGNLSGSAKYQTAGKRLLATAPLWLPHDPACSDIKSLWLSREQAYAYWDASQGASWGITDTLSLVGDPSKVDVRIHESMNRVIDDLPPPPSYPFTVDMDLAKQGKPLFEQQCASACHLPNNPNVYNIGTDMNRARQISPTARLGFLELIREVCELYVERGGSDWCRPKRGSRAADDEAYFVTPRGDKAGYKADVLHGIWAQAPYLHNGSVPTLWHLLRPGERPTKFIRGNIKYDEARVGFLWDKAPTLDEYGVGDAVHYAQHDTALRGDSNAGHAFGSQWSNDEARMVIEYMKTL